MNRIISLLLIALIFSSCKKEKTIWETDWSTPLISDTLSLDKLVNDSTLTNSGGDYLLDLNRTLLDLNLADLITIPDTTISEEFIPGAALTLSPGFSFVNSVEEHQMNIPDVQLKIIVLKEGFIDVKVKNPLPTITIFDVQLPGVTKNGVTFSKQYQAPAMSNGVIGVVQESIDLAGYQIDLTGITGGSVNFLRSQITVITDPAGPSVSITPSDITNVDATFRDIKINYARGYFGNKIIADTSNVFIDALNNVSNGIIDLPASTIQFHIENGIKVNAEAKFNYVTNENAAGNVVSLISLNIGNPINMNAATGSWNTLVPFEQVVEFNSTNSNIEAYLENLGANHKFAYSMQLNPWGNTSGSWDEIFPQSKLKIGITANMPLAIGLDNLILKDTFEVSLNQDPNKTNVKSGELILQASNAFPISGEIKIYLINEDGSLASTIVGSSQLKSSLTGTIDATTGLLVENSELRFVLSEDAVNSIDNVKSLVLETKFNSTNPLTGLSEQQNIPFGAFLAVKLKTKFKTENKF